MTLGQFIRRQRTQQGMTQTQLGVVLGLAQPQVSRIEADQQVPTWDQMKTLSRVLAFDLAEAPPSPKRAA